VKPNHRNRTDELLRALSPVADADLEPVAGSREWQLLRDEIAAVPRDAPRHRRSSERRRILPRLTPPRLALASAAAALAVVAVAAFPSSRDDSGVAQAAIRFKTQGNDIVADVRRPFAAQEELNAAFAAEGLDINLTLVPASPSIVGTVVFVGDGGDGAGTIEALAGGDCVTGGGACPIGLRIPRDFSGQAEIALGRPAESGERYASTADAFAPGEALHCKATPGSTVGEVLPVLERVYAAVEWRDRDGGVLDRPPPSGHTVERVDPVSADSAIVWTAGEPNRTQAIEEYRRSLEAGC
jgi:hypothetical protein